MSNWNYQAFQELISDKVDFSVIIGKPLSGKTFLAKLLDKHLGFKIIDMTEVEKVVKKRLGTEEEPFEGEVPVAEIEKEIFSVFDKDMQSGKKYHYVFDSYTHKNVADFAGFVHRIGTPVYIIEAVINDNKTILERFKKRNEVEEISEEQLDEIKSAQVAADQNIGAFLEMFREEAETGRVKIHS